MTKPTAQEILKQMREAGYDVQNAGFKVNGQTAYKIHGKPGVHTIQGMALNFLGY